MSGQSSRSAWSEAIVVGVVVLALSVVSHPNPVATLGRLYDDVVYLSVGKAIAAGDGYRSAHLVGEPVQVKFPPLLPVIYAAGWRVFGSLDRVATMALALNLIVTAAGAAGLWWLARRELGIGRVLAGLFVIVPLLTDRTMFYFSGAASEPWMLLGWTLALILARRIAHVPGDRGVFPMALTLGVTIALTALARVQGVVIGIAILAALPFARVPRRAVAVATIAAIAPLLIWGVWHAAMVARGTVSPLPDQVSYTSWIPMSDVGALTDFVVRMSTISVPLYFRHTADILMGWVSVKTLLIGAGFLGFGLLGIVLLVRPFPALALSLAATLGVLVVWPYVQDRFLTPVLPVLGLAGAYAAQRVIDRLPVPMRRASIGMAVVLAGIVIAINARMRYEGVRGASQSRFVQAMSGIAIWVTINTTASDRIMVPWGGAVYLRTGRRTSIPNPEEPALAPSVLDAPRQFYASRLLTDSVDVVVIWDGAPGRAAPWLRDLAARCPGSLVEQAYAPDSTTRAVAARDLHFFRVRRDIQCLAAFARGG